MITSFSRRAIEIIKHIPLGMVSSYGMIASYAGNRFGARQIVMLLNSSSKKENLPWHRIVNSKGFISLPQGGGYELQKSLLLEEGIEFDDNDRIDFQRFLWNPLDNFKF
jgi:methylated-DNA-protein-cysteine methyltransferase-like protein